MAGRLLDAFAQENPERSFGYSQEKFSMANDDEYWERFVLDEWQRDTRKSLFVLENLERIVDDRDARRLIVKLLDRPHPSRRIIICSRVSPPLRTSAFAPPNETVTIGPDDFRFDAAEIAMAFNDVLPLDDKQLAIIEQLTQGWPIAVLLLVQLAGKGLLIPTVDALRGLSSEHINEYLIQEVFQYLDSDQRDLLIAAAAIPQATKRDVEYALDRSQRTENQLIDMSTPFLVRNGEFINVHPLVKHLIEQRYFNHAKQFLMHAAEGYLNDNHRIRAAQLFLASGYTEKAASAIAPEANWLTNSSPELLELVSAFERADRETLFEYPALWCTSVLWRIHTMNLIEFLDEARLMWKRYFLIESPTIRMGIMSGLVNILILLGRISEAAKTIDLYEATSKDETSLGEQLIIYLRSALSAFEGIPFDLDKATEKLSTQFLTSARSSALWYSCAVARVYRIAGERDLERSILSRAIDCAIHSKTNYCVGVALADATFSSWFWGEDELFDGYLARLEDNLTLSCELRFRFFIECVRGRGAAARSWFEKMNVFSLTYLTYASLIAGSLSVDPGEARRFIFEALAAADESSQGFVKIITRVALALLDSKRAEELLAEADRLARKSQSSKLVEAVAALQSGNDDLGMLTHFVARFRNDRHHSKLPTLNVSLVARNVRYGDVEIALSKRGLELVLFLAHQRQSISAHTIAEAMWPGKSSALDTLYVTVGRLRSRLPIEAVDRQGDGYRLTRNVVVDLVIMEERCRAIHGHLPLSESQRSELTVICNRLSVSSNYMVPWEWFEGTQACLTR